MKEIPGRGSRGLFRG